jgi:hypothetical protein
MGGGRDVVGFVWYDGGRGHREVVEGDVELLSWGY